jgi:hypothetical protein
MIESSAISSLDKKDANLILTQVTDKMIIVYKAYEYR